MMPEPQTFLFEDDGTIPNSRLPLLVYRDAVPADAASIERLFATNRWPPAWRGVPADQKVAISLYCPSDWIGNGRDHRFGAA